MIILGSSSPRRKELLGSIVPDFIIRKPDTDESVLDDESAHRYCLRVAREKREALLPITDAGNIILITSDTTVSKDDHILGKPTDREDAVRMLSILQGETHQVLSSIALYALIDGKEIRADGLESTDVTFKSLNIQEIERYLDAVHVYDKAGAYAAQEQGKLIISGIEGSITNVIGLPMRLLFSLLSENDLLRFIF
ncbi:MAG TPA: Maf family protein [Spirochaetota bacterium]